MLRLLPGAGREGRKGLTLLPRRLGLNRSRRPHHEGAQEQRSFWDMLLGPYPSEREVKVQEYIIHRLGESAANGRGRSPCVGVYGSAKTDGSKCITRKS